MMKEKRKQYYLEGVALGVVAFACFGAAAAAPGAYQPLLQAGVMGVSGFVGVVASYYSVKAAIAALMSPSEEADPSALTGSQN